MQMPLSSAAFNPDLKLVWAEETELAVLQSP